MKDTAFIFRWGLVLGAFVSVMLFMAATWSEPEPTTSPLTRKWVCHDMKGCTATYTDAGGVQHKVIFRYGDIVTNYKYTTSTDDGWCLGGERCGHK